MTINCDETTTDGLDLALIFTHTSTPMTYELTYPNAATLADGYEAFDATEGFTVTHVCTMSECVHRRPAIPFTFGM
jgi:hypothetical protein